MKYSVIFAVCVWPFLYVSGNGTCQRPVVPNLYLDSNEKTYRNKVEIYYGCEEGWKLPGQFWWATSTCINGAWSPTPKCIPQDSCSPLPVVPNGRPTGNNIKELYSNGDFVEFVCDIGYEREGKKNAYCTDGIWNIVPKCIKKKKTCEAPPRVNHAVILQPFRHVFDLNEEVNYICVDGYNLVNGTKTICDDQKWIHVPRCIRKQEEALKPAPKPTPSKKPAVTIPEADPVVVVVGSESPECGPHPKILNADVTKESKKELLYQCFKYYKLTGSAKVTCQNGKWSRLPTCIPPCQLDQNLFYYKLTETYLEHDKQYEDYCSKYYDYHDGYIHVKCDRGRLLRRGCGYNEW